VPNAWRTDWIQGDTTIKAYISDIQGCTVGGVDDSTIRLMGEVSAKNAQVVGTGLKVEFDGYDAVQSLGTPYPGMGYYPTVQGRFKKGNDDVFSGKGRVEIISTKAQPKSQASN
jgi:hypothetical protein